MFRKRLEEENIPEQLVELISRMIPGSKGEELGDAYQYAGMYPPITKQSLSELDIQNIINNIKLRHDVNFDRDLSFRPNLDGVKGQEKLRAAKRYWDALVAELELYARLFQGSPSLCNSKNLNWPALAQHAQRRIPLMFETIQEVLKSLVPDRDQSRVDEHLDVAMLMQEIEKGVCDLVRLSEWMSHLLKEHCAPMRDDWVDKMVEWTRSGVSENSSESIVKGLRELLGILEAMKLDVANHQIRNLRGLLIEDTINFERNYHLGRIVQGRGGINVEAAQQWYASELQRLRKPCTPQKDALRFQLEIFVRAVVSILFSNDPCCDFPETFYLDQDRLRALKAELHDLVCYEICFDMFGQLLKGLCYHGPISHTTRHNLRTSLSAIMGEGAGHGVSQWMVNCENISLELVRHALHTSGCQPNYDLDLIHKANKHLHKMFLNSFPEHAFILEESILPQVLSCINKNLHASPIDIFNTLVPPSNPPPPPPPSQSSVSVLHITSDTLSPQPEPFTDLASRVTHIILLHWRTWGPLVYVLPQDESMSTSEMSEETQPKPQHPTLPRPPVEEDALAALTVVVTTVPEASHL
ncbi:hypothetical protein K469DRAFT_580136 [Zopfia rhizophila CBS 207.26]|uniref:Tcp11-domain-containing protein n=1 Tax=Zopfia rhizophila CBS 207.26 TaxID=1314779 RepID=A0A6A6DXF8_9PEZI|nr:hypothetical protein K469DRAFT_580136 [Zopfia rhizophila CBS 207.26]